MSAAEISAAARAAYEASLDATGDQGAALDAAAERVAELAGGRTGTFDAESLTWVFDDAP